MVYQLIHQHRLSEPTRNPLSQLAFKVNRKIYSYLRAYVNPLVSLKIGDYELKLPLAHDLPFILKFFPQYATNLGRIANNDFH
jgi:hypothetical protein